ncbi:hypothetical protein GH714_022224 [Hevea brasiliensis]|uniref:Uncharacterized protein n=1 Tax=Hevea brasiliensis TaxID=3981 RepID=A0A6A6LBC9_HEVBR|nr:hypothetical protein GH714_022224 [Hevea brasiliensis]
MQIHSTGKALDGVGNGKAMQKDVVYGSKGRHRPKELPWKDLTIRRTRAETSPEVNDPSLGVKIGIAKEFQKWVVIGRNATFVEMVNHAKKLEEINNRMDDHKESRQGAQKQTTFEHGGSSSKKGKFQAIKGQGVLDLHHHRDNLAGLSTIMLVLLLLTRVDPSIFPHAISVEDFIERSVRVLLGNVTYVVRWAILLESAQISDLLWP